MRAIQFKKLTTLTAEKLDYICVVVKETTGTAVTDFDFYTFSSVLDGVVPHFSSAPFVSLRKLFRFILIFLFYLFIFLMKKKFHLF